MTDQFTRTVTNTQTMNKSKSHNTYQNNSKVQNIIIYRYFFNKLRFKNILYFDCVKVSDYVLNKQQKKFGKTQTINNTI